MFNNFFRKKKKVPFMEKYCTAGQATVNTGHAYSMLDTKGYKHFQNM